MTEFQLGRRHSLCRLWPQFNIYRKKIKRNKIIIVKASQFMLLISFFFNVISLFFFLISFNSQYVTSGYWFFFIFDMLDVGCLPSVCIKTFTAAVCTKYNLKQKCSAQWPCWKMATTPVPEWICIFTCGFCKLIVCRLRQHIITRCVYLRRTHLTFIARE